MFYFVSRRWCLGNPILLILLSRCIGCWLFVPSRLMVLMLDVVTRGESLRLPDKRRPKVRTTLTFFFFNNGDVESLEAIVTYVFLIRLVTQIRTLTNEKDAYLQTLIWIRAFKPPKRVYTSLFDYDGRLIGTEMSFQSGRRSWNNNPFHCVCKRIRIFVKELISERNSDITNKISLAIWGITMWSAMHLGLS